MKESGKGMGAEEFPQPPCGIEAMGARNSFRINVACHRSHRESVNVSEQRTLKRNKFRAPSEAVDALRRPSYSFAPIPLPDLRP